MPDTEVTTEATAALDQCLRIIELSIGLRGKEHREMVNSLTARVREVHDTIESAGAVSAKQIAALADWEETVRKWLPKTGAFAAKEE